MSELSKPTASPTVLRHPQLRDAARIQSLVEQGGVLDRNSCYMYLLLCRDFADTCLVAESDGNVVGFVTAYCPPQRPDVLFVWQIGVHTGQQRRGLAMRMLLQLLHSPATAGTRWLEATVTPCNTASRRLFQRIADHFDVRLTESDGFQPSHFSAPEHEAEPLLQIGPLPPRSHDPRTDAASVPALNSNTETV